ncbi:hypothetical protein SFUMM280S_07643 [Streptomyces fumanus]
MLDRPEGPELTLSLTAPAGLLDEAVLRDLAGRWVAMLGGLAGHAADPAAGGHTPSDFPLVTLTQEQVDGLQAAHPALTDIRPLAPLQEGCCSTPDTRATAQTKAKATAKATVAATTPTSGSVRWNSPAHWTQPGSARHGRLCWRGTPTWAPRSSPRPGRTGRSR